MPAIVRDDDSRAVRARDFGDVRVVDPSAGDRIAGGRAEHRCSIGSRKIVHGHPPEDFLEKKNCGVGRRDAVFRWQACRDGKELETAMPARRRRLDVLLGDSVQQRLRRRALGAEVDESG